jgi:NADH:ubiquinone oxidoreductase subunit 5 (subunit L)/multisubunit Na+/H+ antiporter MnhA subunit
LQCLFFGTVLAYLIYVQHIKIGDKTVNEWFKSNFAIIYAGSSNKWWIDEIYDAIVAGFMFFFRATWKIIEVVFIEGLIINGICWRGTEFVGEVLKVQQSGKLQNYVLVMLSAAMLTVAWFIFN